MPKAESVPSTQRPSAPSRRSFLGRAALLPVAAAIVPAVAQASQAPDPVVALYARWHAARTACDAANCRHAALRADFVRRYGELLESVSVWRAWEADPQHAELLRLREESDDWSNEAIDILDALVETPATSAEGAVCKVKVLARTWTYIEGPNANPDGHEEMTLAFLRDAARVLGDGSAA